MLTPSVSHEVYDDPSRVEGKDYVLQIKVKNGPLLRAIRIRGYKNINQFSKASGIWPGSIGRYLALKEPALTKKGKWTPTVIRMAKALRLPPDSLFPEQHLTQCLKISSGEVEVSKEEIIALMAPDPDHEDRKPIYDRLKQMLTKLSPREERLLRIRYGLDDAVPRTLDEAGEEFGVTRERIRQIECKAMRRLKLRVKEFAEVGYVPAENILYERRMNKQARAAYAIPRRAEPRRVDVAKAVPWETIQRDPNVIGRATHEKGHELAMFQHHVQNKWTADECRSFGERIMRFYPGRGPMFNYDEIMFFCLSRIHQAIGRKYNAPD